MSQNIVGYITSRPLREGFIPQQVQNLYIKNYIEAQNSKFLLSWTEFKETTILVFNSLLLEKFYDGICFYSIEQLLQFPDSIQQLHSLKHKNIWIGFAKEGLNFKGEKNFDSVLKMAWLMQCMASENPIHLDSK